jgi:hypothetical protein
VSFRLPSRLAAIDIVNLNQSEPLDAERSCDSCTYQLLMNELRREVSCDRVDSRCMHTDHVLYYPGIKASILV